MYTNYALGGASKVSPVLHSARTLRVRQRPLGRECRTGLFIFGDVVQINCLTCNKLFEPTCSWNKYCCSKCQRSSPSKKLLTQAFQQARRDFINKIKTERGCVICGYFAHPAALDFNHIQGDKTFAISQDPTVAMHKLLAEIDKCEILCSNCHRVHTYENRHWHTKRKTKVDV